MGENKQQPQWQQPELPGIGSEPPRTIGSAADHVWAVRALRSLLVRSLELGVSDLRALQRAV